MKPVELRVARIGNSRGVRIPAPTLKRYGIGLTLLMEERSDGILLRPRHSAGSKLSWQETASEMAAAAEDWGEWDTTSSDGLKDISWEKEPSRRVSEPKVKYNRKRRRARR